MWAPGMTDDDGEGQRARAIPREKILVLPSLTNTKLLCFVNMKSPATAGSELNEVPLTQVFPETQHPEFVAGGGWPGAHCLAPGAL